MESLKSKLKIISLIGLALFLSSCASHHRKDGPPNFYVDETKIPNAKPKPEPLAKYGNMRFYDVFGKRYFTLKSSQHFQQVGIASWYGTQFDSHHTSSGERYNMLAMTAAHRTLPLPTYVEVTNLQNHRKIIVKVNDRGPFAPNRIIDLSYVAAKKLGMLAHGTAMVRIKAIDPYAYGRTYNLAKKTLWKKPSTQPMMFVQVGAFKDRARAEKLRRHLIGLLNMPVKISAGKLYKVQIGPIRDVATANKISGRLKSLGMRCYLS